MRGGAVQDVMGLIVRSPAPIKLGDAFNGVDFFAAKVPWWIWILATGLGTWWFLIGRKGGK